MHVWQRLICANPLRLSWRRYQCLGPCCIESHSRAAAPVKFHCTSPIVSRIHIRHTACIVMVCHGVWGVDISSDALCKSSMRPKCRPFEVSCRQVIVSSQAQHCDFCRGNTNTVIHLLLPPLALSSIGGSLLRQQLQAGVKKTHLLEE